MSASHIAERWDEIGGQLDASFFIWIFIQLFLHGIIKNNNNFKIYTVFSQSKD